MRVDFQNFLVKSDTVCDYIPFISTVNNVVDIFQKIVVIPFLNKSHLSSNGYYAHLAAKSWTRCFVSLIPLVGNIFVIISDLFRTSGAALPKVDKMPKIDLETERRNLIAKLPEEWDAFKKAPEYLRSDPATALAAIEKDEDNIAFVNKELWENRNFILGVFQIAEKENSDDLLSFYLISGLSKIRKDPELFDKFFRFVNKKDGPKLSNKKFVTELSNFEACACEIYNIKTPQEALKAIKKNVPILLLNPDFLKNKEFMSAAVEIDPNFFRFASGGIEKDVAIIRKLLFQNQGNVDHLSTDIFADKDLVIQIFGTDTDSDDRLWLKLNQKLREERSVWLAFLKGKQYFPPVPWDEVGSYASLPEALKTDKEFALQAIPSFKNARYIHKSLSENLQKDKDVLEAVQSHWSFNLK